MKKGEKVEFDPSKHCGAKTRSGNVCLHPLGMGTSHQGSGRCRKHAGNSKGATTPEGKAKRDQAQLEAVNQPRANGDRKISADLYGDRLTGKIKVTYDQVRGSNSYDLINQMAAMLHATILDGWTSAMNGTRQPWFLNDRKVLKAAEMLLEEGEVDEEYVTRLRLKLMGYDEKGWAALANHAASLIDKAQSMVKMDSHLALMKNFLTQVLSLQEERTTQLGVAILKQLVVDSGFPVEECDRILAESRNNTAMRSVNTDAVDVDD